MWCLFFSSIALVCLIFEWKLESLTSFSGHGISLWLIFSLSLDYTISWLVFNSDVFAPKFTSCLLFTSSVYVFPYFFPSYLHPSKALHQSDVILYHQMDIPVGFKKGCSHWKLCRHAPDLMGDKTDHISYKTRNLVFNMSLSGSCTIKNLCLVIFSCSYIAFLRFGKGPTLLDDLDHTKMFVKTFSTNTETFWNWVTKFDYVEQYGSTMVCFLLVSDFSFSLIKWLSVTCFLVCYEPYFAINRPRNQYCYNVMVLPWLAGFIPALVNRYCFAALNLKLF